MLRILLAALSLAIAVGTAAQGPADPTKDGAKKAAAKATPKPKAKAPQPAGRPAWAELTADQQQVLEPLKAEWDMLERERRLKWIAIAKRYPRMKPIEQERVQRRMQTWANLSPDQRKRARENYKHLAKTPRPATKKDLRQAWAEYQALSPSERQSLVPPSSNDPRRRQKR